MVDAGIECPDDVIQKFKQLQTGHRYHFIIFKIQDKKRVIVESTHDNDDTDEGDWDWDKFCDTITETGEPRFAACDFHYQSKDDLDKTKLLFVSWTPETARPGDKMLYASTKEGFKSKLDGVQKVLQATDESDLDHTSICQNVVDTL